LGREMGKTNVRQVVIRLKEKGGGRGRRRFRGGEELREMDKKSSHVGRGEDKRTPRMDEKGEE